VSGRIDLNGFIIYAGDKLKAANRVQRSGNRVRFGHVFDRLVIAKPEGHYLPKFAPKRWRFKKSLNPSWNSRKPALASQVLETPPLGGFADTMMNRYNGK